MPEAAAKPLPPAPDDVPHTNVDTPDTRRIFIWDGRNPVRSTENMMEAIVEEADLFNLNEALVWLDDGKLRTVALAVLRDEIFPKHICHRVLKGTPDKPEVGYEPFAFPPVADLTREPDERALHIMLGIKQFDRSSIPGGYSRAYRRCERA
jgi:hypothetical protein